MPTQWFLGHVTHIGKGNRMHIVSYLHGNCDVGIERYTENAEVCFFIFVRNVTVGAGFTGDSVSHVMLPNTLIYSYTQTEIL